MSRRRADRGFTLVDTPILTGAIGEDRVLFTTLWPEEATYPTITTVLAYEGSALVKVHFAYGLSLRLA